MKKAVQKKPVFSSFHAGVEPELSGDGPRPIRRRKRDGEHPIIKLLALLFMLPGFGFLVRVVLMSLSLWFGAWVPGTVFNRQISQDDEGVSRSIEFSYSVGSQQFSSGTNVARATYAAISDDSKLRVRVWPPLPEWSAIPFWNGRSLGVSRASQLTFALVWLGIVALPFYSGFFKRLEDRQLVRYGTPITGRVTRKETEDGDTTTHCLHYEFPDGQETRNGKVVVSSDEFTFFDEGESLTILFDPTHPELNTPYRFAFYQAK